MDLYNLVVSAKLQKGGGGGDVDVDPVTITENGVYSASSGHAYSPVTVSVPQSGITPTGTKDINANGIYDVTNFASASVSVPVGVFPSGTSQITSNGIYDIETFKSASVNVPGIVPSGTSSITANGIYDITNFASVDVNVSGGGGGDHDAEDGIIQRKLSGAYENSRVTAVNKYAFYGCSKLTSVSFENVTAVDSSAFAYCSSIANISFPKLQRVFNTAFASCYALTSVYLPEASMVSNQAFTYCSALSLVSLPSAWAIGSNAFSNCSRLESVFLLGSSVASMGNYNAFTGTPMSSSTTLGHFGSIYVPASLVDSYKAANNWSWYADRITSYVE